MRSRGCWGWCNLPAGARMASSLFHSYKTGFHRKPHKLLFIDNFIRCGSRIVLLKNVLRIIPASCFSFTVKQKYYTENLKNLDMVDNLCEVWCKVFPHQIFYRHKTGFPTYKLSLGKTDLVLDCCSSHSLAQCYKNWFNTGENI